MIQLMEVLHLSIIDKYCDIFFVVVAFFNEPSITVRMNRSIHFWPVLYPSFFFHFELKTKHDNYCCIFHLYIFKKIFSFIIKHFNIPVCRTFYYFFFLLAFFHWFCFSSSFVYTVNVLEKNNEWDIEIYTHNKIK
jgi:hypothetical protein